MLFNSDEAAKLLGNRINQPHYIKWMIEKCIEESNKVARAKALEDAAKACDSMWSGEQFKATPKDCANAIRALKE